MRRFAASGPGSWLFARVLHRIDRPIYRLTGGRHTLASLVSGLPVVMLTAHGTVDNAVEALKTGAFDYITKPFDQAEIRTIVKKALRTRDLAGTEATREEAREGAGAR